MEHCDTVEEGILVCLHKNWVSFDTAVGYHCKLTACLYRIIESERLHDDADKADDRSEKTKDPDHSHDIEDRMGACSSLCRCIRNSRCDVSRDCSTYVLTKHHGHSKLEVDEAGSSKEHCDRHRSAGSLKDDCKHRTRDKEEEHRAESEAVDASEEAHHA